MAALRTFLDSLINELKETTCLSPDVYSRVASCLQNGDLRELSGRLRTWANFHRLCSGSERYYLILAPRDPVHAMPEADFEKLRRSYCQKVDNTLSGTLEKVDSDEVLFDRLPLQPQVYDILSYAHRSHAPLSEMLTEIKVLGFVSRSWYVRLDV